MCTNNNPIFYDLKFYDSRDIPDICSRKKSHLVWGEEFINV